ncbi:MAG: hypothetical protein E6Q98_15840 [Rhodospirillaceae bacterium]|nr:MAG: hypothetical protein E6Q98_15840 [Rhodospirillaceae bacterium]
MSDIISFQNPGLIDKAAITTIGVSVKEGPNPIGFFGTGLKYAIAIILRGGGEITIHRGLEEMTFSTVQESIRGKEFGIVTLNGQPLGFTDELGKTWQPWMAVRELYCNMKDETGECAVGMMEPAEGKTTIWVNWKPFSDAFAKLGSIILQTTPFIETGVAEIHQGGGHDIFYRGVKVGLHDKHFAYTYNMKKAQDLTEDRTLRYTFCTLHDIARAVLGCEDAEFIERWLSRGNDYAEHTLDLDISTEPSPAFLVAARNVLSDTSRPCNPTASKVLAKYEPLPIPVPCSLTAMEQAELDRAIAFCREINYTVDEYPIIVMDALGPSVLAQADRDKRAIFLSRQVFQIGDKKLAHALIEEWAHIKHGHNDLTYGFQTWIFEQLVHVGKQLVFERQQASGCQVAA